MCSDQRKRIRRFISSDTGDGIFRLWGSITYLLMHWLLKSSAHQRPWYRQWSIDNMYGCSRVNIILLGQSKSNINFKMWINILYLKAFIMLMVDLKQHLLGKHAEFWRRCHACMFVHETNMWMVDSSERYISLTLTYIIYVTGYKNNSDSLRVHFKMTSVVPEAGFKGMEK